MIQGMRHLKFFSGSCTLCIISFCSIVLICYVPCFVIYLGQFVKYLPLLIIIFLFSIAETAFILVCYLGLRRIKIATDCISSTFLGYKVSINSKDIREIGRNREFIYFSTVTLTERQRKNADLFFFLHPKKIIYLNERKEMLPFIYSVCKRQGMVIFCS